MRHRSEAFHIPSIQFRHLRASNTQISRALFFHCFHSDLCLSNMKINCCYRYFSLIGNRLVTAMLLPFGKWSFLILLSVGISQPAYADEVLFTAEYEGMFSGMTIKSTRRLIAQDGGQYRFESIIKNTFSSITDESQFNLNEGKIIPQHYHYKRSIMKFKADESIDFDWQNGIAKYRRKKKENKNRDHNVIPGVLDPALYQLQLQRDLFNQSSELSYDFVKSNKVKTLMFAIKGEESLSVGKNSYQAIKVERINLDDKDETRIWVVPALDFQIARIQHIEESGESYNIYLTAFKSSADLVERFYRSNIHTTLSQ